MLPVGLIIDLSLVRRLDADGLEALTIAATLAGESDIAFWARSRCIQSVRRRGRGSAQGTQERPPTLPVALGAVSCEFGPAVLPASSNSSY